MSRTGPFKTVPDNFWQGRVRNARDFHGAARTLFELSQDDGAGSHPANAGLDPARAGGSGSVDQFRPMPTSVTGIRRRRRSPLVFTKARARDLMPLASRAPCVASPIRGEPSCPDQPTCGKPLPSKWASSQRKGCGQLQRPAWQTRLVRPQRLLETWLGLAFVGHGRCRT